MAPFFPISSFNNPKFNMTTPGDEHPSGVPEINTTASSGPDALGASRATFSGNTSGENPFQTSNPFNGTTSFNGTGPFNTTTHLNSTLPFNTKTTNGSSNNTLPTPLTHTTFNTIYTSTSIPQPLFPRTHLPHPPQPPSGTTTTTATIFALAATLPITSPTSTTTARPTLPPQLQSQLTPSLPLGYYPWLPWSTMPNTKLILTLLLLIIFGTWIGMGYCAFQRRRVRKYGVKIKENTRKDTKGLGMWHRKWWRDGVLGAGNGNGNGNGKTGTREGEAGKDVEMI